MNVFDFDKTIFYPDSSAVFIRFLTLRHPLAAARNIPYLMVKSIRCVAKSFQAKEIKEGLFGMLRFISDPSEEIKMFWERYRCNIGSWYKDVHKDNDIIITASPEFLIKPIGHELGCCVLGTVMDINTGRIKGLNCHDSEKVRRYHEVFGDAQIDEFYSDSLSDSPLAEISKNAFMVMKGTVNPWPDSGF